MCLQEGRLEGGRKSENIGRGRVTQVVGLVLEHWMLETIMNNYVNYVALS